MDALAGAIVGKAMAWGRRGFRVTLQLYRGRTARNTRLFQRLICYIFVETARLGLCSGRTGLGRLPHNDRSHSCAHFSTGRLRVLGSWGSMDGSRQRP